MQEVDLAMFAEAHADGPTVIDVRDLGENASGHVPGAQLIPLVRLPRHLADLPATGGSTWYAAPPPGGAPASRSRWVVSGE